MTEFEIATLAFQEATLAFQEAALGIREATLEIQKSTLEIRKSNLEIQKSNLAVRKTGLWIAAAHVAVGLIQAGIVWYGIRAMQRVGDRRAQEQDQRHTEAMTALRELIVRTAPAGHR